MGRWGIVVVLAVLVVLGAEPAGGATRLASFDEPHGGIEFAGAALLYGERKGWYAYEGDVIVRSVRPGRAPRVLAHERHPGDGFDMWDLDVAFAGTADRVLIARADSRDEDYDSHSTETVYSKRRLRAIGRDRFQADVCALRSAAPTALVPRVSGDAFLAPESACKAFGLAVRSLSQRGAIVQRYPDATAGEEFDLSGDLAAYRDPSRPIVVTNWRTGEVLYSAPAPARPVLDGMRLLAGGTLVLFSTERYGCDGRIATATPSDPTPRELPVRYCSGPVEAAGRRIAFLRPAGREQELVTADLDGRDVRPVARFGRDALVAVDLATGTVAWEVTRCGDTVIMSSLLAVERVEPAPPVHCPASIPRREIDVSSKGLVSIPVRCPIGCRVSSGELEFEKAQGSHSGYLNVRRGTGRIRFALREETLARLRRHGGLRGKLEYYVEQPGRDEKQRFAPVVLRP